MQEVILLHAERAPGSAPRWYDALLARLPYARRLELERRDADSRAASLAGLGLALAAVARVDARPWRVADLRFPEGRKPRLESGPCFSVSHSRAVVCAAAAGVGDIGLDVEALPPGTTGTELARLRRWSAIEATLKAAGAGVESRERVSLARDLRSATFSGRRYVLTPWGRDGAIGHVAAPASFRLTVQACDLEGLEVSATVERTLGLAAQREQ